MRGNKMLVPYDLSTFINIVKEKENWYDSSLGEIRKDITEYLKDACKHKCFFCRSEIDDANVTVEHIVGKNDYKVFTFKPENLILCCKECNALKNDDNVFTQSVNKNSLNSWDDYPFESKYYTIIHPYLDNYDECIKKTEIFYKGIDANGKGKTTIKLYKLYRLTLAERNMLKWRKEEESKKLDEESKKIETLIYNALSPGANNEELRKDIRKLMKELKDISAKKQGLLETPINIKFKPFDEFVVRKFGDSKTESLNIDIQNSINNLDESIIKNFEKVDLKYLKGENIEECSPEELNDACVILEIMEHNLHFKKWRNDLQVICKNDFDEIGKYYKKDVFIKSENKMILTTLKYLIILSMLKSKNIINDPDKLYKDIQQELNILKERLNKVSMVI